MNKIKEVAKVLGYEVGEEFNIIFGNGEYSEYNPFKFTETSLVDKDGEVVNNHIGCIITGYYTTEKIPFKPKHGELYWSIDIKEKIRVSDYCWEDDLVDYNHKLLNLVFRTKEEAEEALVKHIKNLKAVGYKEKKVKDRIIIDEEEI